MHRYCYWPRMIRDMHRWRFPACRTRFCGVPSSTRAVLFSSFACVSSSGIMSRPSWLPSQDHMTDYEDRARFENFLQQSSASAMPTVVHTKLLCAGSRDAGAVEKSAEIFCVTFCGLQGRRRYIAGIQDPGVRSTSPQTQNHTVADRWRGAPRCASLARGIV